MAQLEVMELQMSQPVVAEVVAEVGDLFLYILSQQSPLPEVCKLLVDRVDLVLLELVLVDLVVLVE
jgi:hypothetical protein